MPCEFNGSTFSLFIKFILGDDFCTASGEESPEKDDNVGLGQLLSCDFDCFPGVFFVETEGLGALSTFFVLTLPLIFDKAFILLLLH